ncbi:MAG: hypothetical protein MJ197_09385, partial [Bacteroidales bacterium]|nr:hypothetical protein [Bacteroidales bacterium]
LIGIALTIVLISFHKIKNEQIEYDNNQSVFEPTQIEQKTVTTKPFGKQTNDTTIERLDTTINDIGLSIFIPHNAKTKLCKGQPSKTDTNILMCAQAADIRADNKKIVGAFVIAGEPIAWGLSKQGYCAIITNTITIGKAENTPLFEEATEKGGYFFRQYALIDSCRIVENNLKNKSLRKALCQRNSEIFMVTSATPESMHDFAQALVDLGVENAISLVGSGFSIGWYYNNETKDFQDFNEYQKRTIYENETYIVWEK